MKFSVIVIDYKRKIYILDALRSIKNQEEINLNDLELVVVKYYEDEKIDNYIKQNFPNYKIINLDPNDPNHWVGRTLSEGIKNTSNNLIFILEDDDLFRKNKIKFILDFIKKKKLIEKKESFLIHNNWVEADEKLRIEKYDKLKKLQKKYGVLFKNKIMYWHSDSCITIYLRDDKSKNKLIDFIKDLKRAPDAGLVAFFLDNGKVHNNNQILTIYRMSPNSVSRSKDIRIPLDMVYDIVRISNRVKKKKSKIFSISMKDRIIINMRYNYNFPIYILDIYNWLLSFGIKKIFIYFLYKIEKYKMLSTNS